MHPFTLAEKFITYFLNLRNEHGLIVTGILLSGSNAKINKLNIGSDFDLYIIINKEKKYRGVVLINGFEIDYFASSMKQLKYNFKSSLKTPKKILVDMLANGIIIRDSNSELKEIKEDAIKIIRNMPSLTFNEKMMIRYFLKNYLKTLQASINNKFLWQYTYNALMNYLIKVCCRYYRIPLNPKTFYGAICNVDNKFIEFWNSITDKKDKAAKVNAISKIVSYLLKKMGLTLEVEWEIVN